MKEGDHLEALDIDGRIYKMVLKEIEVRVWKGLI